MTMRTRTVVTENASYTIAALTLDQIEHLVAPIGKIGEKPRISTSALVCCGLNNASGDQCWTRERADALDRSVFKQLQDAVLELSGLTGKKVRENIPD